MLRTIKSLWLVLPIALLLSCGDDGGAEAPSADSGNPDTGVADTSTSDTTGDDTGASDTAGDAEPARPNLDGDIPYDTLAEYGFFAGPLLEMQPNEGVYPYTVASPLWADHAEKGRFIVLPEGEQLTFEDNETWGFPEGTILVKSFFFSPDRRDPTGDFVVVETRLLRRVDGAWVSYIYEWNEEQTEATRVRAGKRVELDVIDEDGEAGTQTYLVPNEEECLSCHELNDATKELGVVTPQLNFTTMIDGQPTNQLQWLIDQGAVAGAPDDLDALPSLTEPLGDGDLEARARSYLHGNCGHCHRQGGAGGRSGLRLVWWEEDPNRYGVCKRPVASGGGSGGRSYDIVPGSPDDSIIIFRMSSTEPDIKMPELPNLLPHDDGIDVVSSWISAIEPEGCP